MQNDTALRTPLSNHTAFLTPQKGKPLESVKKGPVKPISWSQLTGHGESGHGIQQHTWSWPLGPKGTSPLINLPPGLSSCALLPASVVNPQGLLLR